MSEWIIFVFRENELIPTLMHIKNDSEPYDLGSGLTDIFNEKVIVIKKSCEKIDLLDRIFLEGEWNLLRHGHAYLK